MKLQTLSAAALLWAAGSAGALDFGVDLSTSFSSTTAAGASISASGRADAHLNQPFDKDGSGLNLTAFGSVDSTGLTADIDTANVTFVAKGLDTGVDRLSWTLGRFRLTEPTGLFLSHPGDGLALDAALGKFDLRINTAYTGFVLRNSSGVALSLADQADVSKTWASPRFVGSVEAEWPWLPGQTLILGGLAQEDLHSKAQQIEEWSSVQDPNRGGAVSTQYFTALSKGTLASVNYQAFATYGSGRVLTWQQDSGYYQYAGVSGLLWGADASFSVPVLPGTVVSLKLLSASGDSDAQSVVEGNSSGAYNQFIPMTGTSLGVVFNPGLVNLVVYQASAAFQPLPSLPLAATAKVIGFQRSVKGIIDAPASLADGPLWIGQEVDGQVSWQVFSDLSAYASAGVFLPSAGGFVAGSGSDVLQFALQGGARLSF